MLHKADIMPTRDFPATREPLTSFEGSRVVDGEGQMLGRLRGCGHQADAFRRLRVVPRPLRDDHHHPCFERYGIAARHPS